jgi:hypothetical protein
VKFRKKLAKEVNGFCPRYNYLTCRENRTRLLVRELGNEERTEVAPARELAQLCGYELDWDERDWITDGSRMKTPAKAKQPPPTSPEEQPGNTRHWFKTPFGYYVPFGDHTGHLLEYYAWTETIKVDGPWNQPGWKARAFLRAWFATYPKEIWKRFF